MNMEQMTLSCCQDHILTENIWFVCSETSYSGDERRCYQCGTNEQPNKQKLKIELLSQWKLEAESRNFFKNVCAKENLCWHNVWKRWGVGSSGGSRERKCHRGFHSPLGNTIIGLSCICILWKRANFWFQVLSTEAASPSPTPPNSVSWSSLPLNWRLHQQQRKHFCHGKVSNECMW